jgi:hypothetical protein
MFVFFAKPIVIFNVTLGGSILVSSLRISIVLYQLVSFHENLVKHMELV